MNELEIYLMPENDELLSDPTKTDIGGDGIEDEDADV